MKRESKLPEDKKFSDDPEENLRLENKFLKMKMMAESGGIFGGSSDSGLSPEIIHTCCSAAAVRLPDMHYDMLRIGIMQYGFWPSPEILIEYLNRHRVVQSPLRRVISWESRVMSLKNVPPGEFIGYGSSFFFAPGYAHSHSAYWICPRF